MPVRAGIGAFFSPLLLNLFILGAILLRCFRAIKNPAGHQGEQGEVSP
jgi:hypothetical protein